MAIRPPAHPSPRARLRDIRGGRLLLWFLVADVLLSACVGAVLLTKLVS